MFVDFNANTDLENPDFTGDPAALNNFIRSQYEGILTSEYDGFFDISNIDSVVHRFKLIRVNDESNFNFSESENQTFMVNEDGRLTFCLAAHVGT